MGATSSTLYVKIKFYTEEGVVVIKGNYKVACQFLVVTNNREIKQKDQVELGSL